MQPMQHPVDILLDALRQGPADIVTLADRTGFYAGAVLSLIERARASGFSISATSKSDVTIYELHEVTI